MKRAIIYIVIILGLFVSCKTQMMDHRTFSGTFYKHLKYKDFNTEYTLELHPDSTFKILINYAGGTTQCMGKWEIKDNSFVMLKCYEDSHLFEFLSSGNMSQKEHMLEIININKIKYEDVVLQRKSKFFKH